MLIKYNIERNASFQEQLYPNVTREMDDLKKRLHEIKSAQKTAIVISLLKDHCIKTEWLDANKQLVTLLTSGSLPTSHLESLFISCKENANFTAGLETYITTKLA